MEHILDVLAVALMMGLSWLSGYWIGGGNGRSRN